MLIRLDCVVLLECIYKNILYLTSRSRLTYLGGPMVFLLRHYEGEEVLRIGAGRCVSNFLLFYYKI